MLRRHDLLRPDPAAWDAMLRHRPGLAEVPLVAEWAQLGRPVIVRRRLPDDGAGDVHATGLSYLTSRSDLHLLWPAAHEAAAASLVQALIRLDAAAPVRLDGELVLPDGAGVQWREFIQADGPTATLLVKTMNGVEARRREELFRTPVPA